MCCSGCTEADADSQKDTLIVKQLTPPRQFPIEYDLCSICLDKMKKDGTRATVAVNCSYLHLYHKDCISKWSKKMKTCPICRDPFNTLYKEIPT